MLLHLMNVASNFFPSSRVDQWDHDLKTAKVQCHIPRKCGSLVHTRTCKCFIHISLHTCLTFPVAEEIQGTYTSITMVLLYGGWSQRLDRRAFKLDHFVGIGVASKT
jgi:hypothetical protein